MLSRHGRRWSIEGLLLGLGLVLKLHLRLLLLKQLLLVLVLEVQHCLLSILARQVGERCHLLRIEHIGHVRASPTHESSRVDAVCGWHVRLVHLSSGSQLRLVHRRHIIATVVHEGCRVNAALHILGRLVSATLVHAWILSGIVVLELVGLGVLGVGLLWLLQLLAVLVGKLLLLLVVLERG